MIKTKKQIELLEPKALPISVHYHNPRNTMPKEIWKQISNKARERTKNHCELCMKKYPKQKLHAHESWEVNYEKALIIFNKIFVLCEMCHKIQHMGLTGYHIEQGILKEEEFNMHLKRVLKLKKNYFELKEEFHKYFLRLEPWRISSAYNEYVYISRVNDIQEELFSIWKEQDPKGFWNMAKAEPVPFEKYKTKKG